MTLAHKYAITGFCRNLDNGDVDCQIQGNKDNLDGFLNEVLKNSHYIRIDDYAIKEIEIVEKETSFDVKY